MHTAKFTKAASKIGRVDTVERRAEKAGRKKVGRWNEQSALQAMCDAEKHWHERSFSASGAFGGRQNLPFNKPEISFSFFIFQPAVHYD